MKPNHQQRGSVTVELALLLIPLILLAFGITEFGRAIYQYNALTKSVRDSARYLSQYAPGPSDQRDKAGCLAVFGNTECRGSPLLPGLTTGNVVFRDRLSNPVTHNLKSTGRGVVNLTTVEISNYRFNSLVPFVVPSFTFDPIQVTMFQAL